MAPKCCSSRASPVAPPETRTRTATPAGRLVVTLLEPPETRTGTVPEGRGSVTATLLTPPITSNEPSPSPLRSASSPDRPPAELDPPGNRPVERDLRGALAPLEGVEGAGVPDGHVAVLRVDLRQRSVETGTEEFFHQGIDAEGDVGGATREHQASARRGAEGSKDFSDSRVVDRCLLHVVISFLILISPRGRAAVAAAAGGLSRMSRSARSMTQTQPATSKRRWNRPLGAPGRTPP